MWPVLAQQASSAANTDVVHTWAFLLMLLLTGGFAVVTILLAEKIGPKKYKKEKYDPYECGVEVTEPVLQRMDVQFYRTSIMFLIFGVELIFLYPWAVWVSRLGLTGLAIGGIFFVLLVVGFLFEWAKGALEWRQARKSRSE